MPASFKPLKPECLQKSLYPLPCSPLSTSRFWALWGCEGRFEASYKHALFRGGGRVFCGFRSGSVGFVGCAKAARDFLFVCEFVISLFC